MKWIWLPLLAGLAGCATGGYQGGYGGSVSPADLQLMQQSQQAIQQFVNPYQNMQHGTRCNPNLTGGFDCYDRGY